MEGKCQGVFQRVAKVYDNAHVLAKVWDDRHIDPERREEIISRLYGMVDDLHDDKMISDEDYQNTFKFFDKLSHFNRGAITKFPDFNKEIDRVTSELAVNAIADCECARNLGETSSSGRIVKWEPSPWDKGYTDPPGIIYQDDRY